MKSWVYILKCSDDSYYTGCTTNLPKRISEHRLGVIDGYTAKRRPVKLLWSQEFSELRYAIEAERRLKKWTRAKKEAMMNGNFELLRALSRSTKTKEKNRNAQPFTPGSPHPGGRNSSRLRRKKRPSP